LSPHSSAASKKRVWGSRLVSGHVHIGAQPRKGPKISSGDQHNLPRGLFAGPFLTNELWCAINSRAAAGFELSPGTGLPIVFLTSQDASTTDVMSFIRAFLYASSPLRNRSQHFLNGLSCVTVSSAFGADSQLRMTLCVWSWPSSSSRHDYPLYFRRVEQ